ncbi:hypothetical protein LEP1GSC188_0011 [Leptospira weilii serovar Topaz str. LT2116]|uniref:Uncharacterized protein n=1 Tax=Leptospira weilii serovar Topaz str. LT2116 TaxID=1088540 RepID=M3G1T2_9LEPT|nr:hypothetical protein LEP1GSC188_0011 [Leptospira weilii serovar Topaz str. LT2116]
MEGIRIHIIRTVPKTLQFTIFDKVKLFGMRCKFKRKRLINRIYR